MSFLPNNYKVPDSSNYTKLGQGETRIRILSSPILGWEDWQDKKPIRFPLDQKPAKPFDPEKLIKHFWAMVVWNYNLEQIQVFCITQKTIQNAITAYANDTDWGSPLSYDIKIIREGEGFDTEYSVLALPHKELKANIKKAYMEKPCNLEALFFGADPFDTSFVIAREVQ